VGGFVGFLTTKWQQELRTGASASHPARNHLPSPKPALVLWHGIPGRACVDNSVSQ